MKRRVPEMNAFGLSGCRVKPRRLWGPGASTTTNIPWKDPKERERERRKKENCGGEGKKARNFGPSHPPGPHPSGPTLA